MFFKIATIEDKNKILDFYNEYYLNNKEIYKPEMALDEWLNKLFCSYQNKELMYLMYRKIDNKLIGISIIRLELNNFLQRYWGNIGYYINITEQNKGYGKQLFRLTLRECKKLGIEKVLIVCYKQNVASAKIIKANKGILIQEILDENNKELLQRYYIQLT